MEKEHISISGKLTKHVAPMYNYYCNDYWTTRAATLSYLTLNSIPHLSSVIILSRYVGCSHAPSSDKGTQHSRLWTFFSSLWRFFFLSFLNISVQHMFTYRAQLLLYDIHKILDYPWSTHESCSFSTDCLISKFKQSLFRNNIKTLSTIRDHLSRRGYTTWTYFSKVPTFKFLADFSKTSDHTMRIWQRCMRLEYFYGTVGFVYM